MAFKLQLTDYEPARGATELWPSPDGRFLAARYNNPSGAKAPPRLDILERASGKVVSTAQGELVAAPDDSGEVLYVAVDTQGPPVVRSTARADFAVPLTLPEGASAGDFYLYGGHRLGQSKDKVVLVWMVAGRTRCTTLSISKGALIAERVLPPAEAVLMATAASPMTDRIYLSLKEHLVALDGATLAEQWRIKLPEKSLWDVDSKLAVTGDGAWVVAAPRNELFAVEAQGGQSSALHPFPGLRVIELHGVPGRSGVVALRLLSAKGYTEEHAIEALELPSGTRQVLRPQTDKDHPAPRALAIIGDTVWIAPQGPEK